jgi:hypothetical protein
MPVILAAQEAEIRRITVKASPGEIARDSISKNTQQKKGLVGWLKRYSACLAIVRP